MFVISNLLNIKNSQVGRTSLITSNGKIFIFGKRFDFQIQCNIFYLGCIEGFFIAQVAYLRVNLPFWEKIQKILSSMGE